MKVFDNIKIINNQIVDNKWIEWYHPGIPNQMGALREIFRLLLFVIGHCLICTRLDGCYFLERKMPNLPQHTRCDCSKLKLNFDNVSDNCRAECDIRKFTEYIFSENSYGKKQLFESLGYYYDDSQLLKEIFELQAKKQYLNGNYKLKNLDINGQRIAIPITINSRKFYSGWMVYPDGVIKNTTPFGGWVSEEI